MDLQAQGREGRGDEGNAERTGMRSGTRKLVLLLISTCLVSLCLVDHQVVVVEEISALIGDNTGEEVQEEGRGLGDPSVQGWRSRPV